ncbi:MAG: TatD family deoxyribonuclease [Alphaproteobacteria bacterium]|nr:TatD family deoxyribonuclease [Alphaproteobacteria bacterium]
MLIDSHCHLDFDDFALDFAAVLARAHAAGIERMLTIGTRLAKLDSVMALADTYPELWCSVGIHPHEAAIDSLATTAALVSRAAHRKVVGIGETGLDYYYDQSPRPAQQHNFRLHIAAARDLGLPLIVHSRDADADMMAILDEEMANGKFSGVIHCFTASAALARKAIELGFYLSFSGIVTFKNAEPLRAIAKEVPEDRILVETDAPYLAPIPMRGRRNEPAFVAHTARFLADLRNTSLDAFSAATTRNFHALFSKTERTSI